MIIDLAFRKTAAHVPGHHGRGMEADGPVVKPGEGYRGIVATKSDLEHREYFEQLAALAQRTTKRLMAEREAEIDAGLVHHTPAMEETLAKLEKVDGAVVARHHALD